MPYKLDCSIGKIISPIVLIFPDGNKQDYLTGNDAIKIIYEKRYDVKSMKVVSDNGTLSEVQAEKLRMLGVV